MPEFTQPQQPQLDELLDLNHVTHIAWDWFQRAGSKQFKFNGGKPEQIELKPFVHPPKEDSVYGYLYMFGNLKYIDLAEEPPLILLTLLLFSGGVKDKVIQTKELLSVLNTGDPEFPTLLPKWIAASSKKIQPLLESKLEPLISEPPVLIVIGHGIALDPVNKSGIPFLKVTFTNDHNGRELSTKLSAKFVQSPAETFRNIVAQLNLPLPDGNNFDELRISTAVFNRGENVKVENYTD